VQTLAQETKEPPPGASDDCASARELRPTSKEGPKFMQRLVAKQKLRTK